ncbi:cation transporter [Synechococcus sp. Cruz CV-v-12]|uniref:cation transporter n=1 Tax=Synechococcus sp. Cruz CV-v-12 TaxID=2823728 RepID=UPI0020CCDE09|nr:cation transporter [Synechococcus sp. Cruz CV-v-12]MCP9874394.1 hypothetical protein [Synechococcus sp. Cruz CV-v-12]
MTTATTVKHNLVIDGMTGDTCVQKVKAALKGVNSVTTDSVAVGSATIECDDAACKAAISAINNVGYKAREGAAADRTSSGDRDASRDGNRDGANSKPGAMPKMGNSKDGDVSHTQAEFADNAKAGAAKPNDRDGKNPAAKPMSH